MNSEKFSELKRSSSAEFQSVLELERMLQQKEGDLRVAARNVIHSQVENMIETGQAFQLTDEEERLIRSFRSFKAKVHTSRALFRWRTSPDPAVIVSAPERVLVSDPQEAPTS